MREAEQKRIGCVVMAAGNAKRFGKNKLLSDFDGKQLIERVLDAVPMELFETCLVVTQYPEIMLLGEQRGFLCLRNERPDLGISHTVALGVQALRDCDAIVFLVSDQPLLTESSVRKVLQAWKENPAGIVSASYRGVRGNPTVFPKRFFPELLALEGDRGGNQVIRAHPESLLLTEIPEAELTDVDTPEALAALQHSID